MVAGWIGILLNWIVTELVPKIGPELAKFGLAFLGALAQIAISLALAALQLGVSIILAIAQGLLDLLGIPINLDGIQKAIVGIIAGWQQSIITAGSGIMKWIADGINSLFRSPADTLAAALGAVINTFNTIMTGVTGFYGHVWSVAKGIVGQIASGLSSVNLGTAMDTALQAAIRVFNTIMTGTTGLGTHVWNVAKGIAGQIASGLSSIDLGSVISIALGKIISTFNTMMTGVTGFYTHVWNVMKGVAEQIGAGLNAANPLDAFSKALWSIINEFNRLMTGSMGFITHVFNVMKDIGKNIINGIIAGLEELWEKIRRKIQALGDLIPQWLKDQLGITSPSIVFTNIGKNIMAGLTQGIEEMTIAPQLALQDATTGMVNGAGGNSTYNNQRTTNNNFNLPWSGGNDRPSDDMFQLVNTLTSVYG